MTPPAVLHTEGPGTGLGPTPPPGALEKGMPMSVQPSEAKAQLAGPCLFGVPVPARAFGFPAGWYRRSERCAEPLSVECSEQIVIDLTGSSDTTTLIQADLWSSGLRSVVGRVVPLKRTAGHDGSHMTIESEVAAA